MSWSRIQNTPLARAAEARMAVEPYRQYHTWDHVQRLYHHAEVTLKLPYDENLDKSIATHDVINDILGENEKRSAIWLKETDPTATQTSQGMILHTENHIPRACDNRLILLDLMDFTCFETTRKNHHLLRLENCEMHSVSAEIFYEKSIEFLQGLLSRISHSAISKTPEADRPYFLDIRKGILHSIDLSRTALCG